MRDAQQDRRARPRFGRTTVGREKELQEDRGFKKTKTEASGDIGEHRRDGVHRVEDAGNPGIGHRLEERR